MSGLKEKVTTASIAIHTLHITAGPHTIHLEVSITGESSKTLGKSFGPYVLSEKRKLEKCIIVLVFNCLFVFISVFYFGKWVF